MIKVEYFGKFCFKVRGKHASVVVDPFLDEGKLDLPERKADLILITEESEDHSYVEGVRDYKYVVSGPGEYEVEDIQVFGGQANGSTFYQFKVDDVSFLHLGTLSELLTDEQLSDLGETDVLFVPVGGVGTIGPEKAAEIVAQVEPRYAVPMNYQMDYEGMEKLAPVEKFIEEMGEEMDKRPELKIKSNTTLPEETEVVVLEL